MPWKGGLALKKLQVVMTFGNENSFHCQLLATLFVESLHLQRLEIKFKELFSPYFFSVHPKQKITKSKHLLFEDNFQIFFV